MVRSFGSSRAGLLVIAMLTGALSSLAFEPYGVWPFYSLFVCFVYWSISCRGTLQSGAAQVMLCSVVHFGIGLFWLVPGLVRAAELSVVLSSLVWVCIVGVMSLKLLLICFWSRLIDRPLLRPLAFGALWALQEHVRALLFSGFPWLTTPETLVDSPFRPMLPYVGGTLLGAIFVILLVGGLELVVRWTAQRFPSRLVFACMPVTSLALAGVILDSQSDRDSSQFIKVGAVHTMRPSQHGWNPDRITQQIDELTATTAPILTPDLRLVVWPESAVPAPDRLIAPFLTRTREVLANTSTTLVFGATKSADGYAIAGEFNVARAVNPDNTYMKRKLVPFGERRPVFPFDLLLADQLAGSRDLFLPGVGRQPLLRTFAGEAIVGICFEAAFSGLLLESDGLSNARLLVVASNDEWFRGTPLVPQHHVIVRLRAAEFGLPAVHSTNGGITSIISEKGKTLASTQAAQPRAITSKIFVPKKPSFYALEIGASALIPTIFLTFVMFLQLITSVSAWKSD
jgi:apolipoprotein N-acyltransferase